LDVGCGYGLLAEKLAAIARSVTGIDPDSASLERARARLADRPNATGMLGDYLVARFAEASFDFVVFVASLHHMDCAAALAKARAELRPGGELIVIGVAARASFGDLAVDALRAPIARAVGLIRHEVPNSGVPTKEPTESLAQIRSIAGRIIPGHRIRRGLYYRYILTWSKPI
jgi:SAM-dependent methyltransferase